ncbi:hypothetical protein DPMN_005086 [Dreissena polymorpha]|uniref:Uncharacterized protein n=1 Tax=Dreissena polymorpha TaxID=45954 RepID=A0A9D4MPM4_DREPO|nr:hypothetical protein DPMN_005086 [Dreissena polymorpha]
MVVSTKSWSLPMSAPGNVLVFAFLKLEICGASMKSIWFCTCPYGACQVSILDGLCGCSVLARVSWWLLLNSRVLEPLSLVSPKPNLPTDPDQSWYSSGALTTKYSWFNQKFAA